MKKQKINSPEFVKEGCLKDKNLARTGASTHPKQDLILFYHKKLYLSSTSTCKGFALDRKHVEIGTD